MLTRSGVRSSLAASEQRVAALAAELEVSGDRGEDRATLTQQVRQEGRRLMCDSFHFNFCDGASRLVDSNAVANMATVSHGQSV